ncbi:hypothetical protein ACFZB5_13465 [Streptomyces nodosus]|uniref:hypothetical protein n=1 Tax=Streptomyces nodosus TaxID=40318 RepID=UPI0036ED253E
MPPRKRTAAESPAKASQEPAPAEPQSEEQQPAADNVEPKDEQGTPELSDLQAVDRPCPKCMPNGWPEGAFSVGCTHGTWLRDNT